jgi:hypothetical protein
MYNNYGYNPYYQPQKFTTSPQQIPMEQQYPSVQQPLNIIKNTLQGKMADSIETIKATDIPLDGSISYFPLTDGSAIVSKQLQVDGTSKIIVYKPMQEDKKEEIKYATIDDLHEAINDIDLSDIQDLKDDVKEIKKQLKEFKIKKGKED